MWPPFDRLVPVLALTLPALFAAPTSALGATLAEESKPLPFRERWSVSAGVANAWTTRKDQLEKLGEADWIVSGHSARLASLGYVYSNTGGRDPARIFASVTVEQYDAPLEYWTRERVGTVSVTVLRLEPMCFRYRSAGSNFYLTASVGGMNVVRGTASVLRGYSLYFPSGNYLYLVKSIDVKPNRIGWSLFGFGLHYRFPRIPLSIGAETMLIEADSPKVIFRTYGGDFEKETIALYGILPVKFRVSLVP